MKLYWYLFLMIGFIASYAQPDARIVLHDSLNTEGHGSGSAVAFGNLLMPSDRLADEVLLIGKQAPPFVLPDLNYDYVFLRNYCGQELKRSFKIKNQQKKIVLLSFFASWCKPCKKEIPHLESIKRQFKDAPVQFFLVNVGESQEKVIQFLDSFDVSLPVLLDIYKKVSEKFKVSTLPRLVLIDRDGIIRGYKIGYSESEEFESRLKKALNILLDK